MVSAGWIVFIWISNGIVQYPSLSFNTTDIKKYIPVVRFIRQPEFFLLIFIVISHVFVKAKKDLFVWPRISIGLESFGILLSGFFIFFIISNGHNMVEITIIMSHFMFLLLRDTLVYFGYKRLVL